jgi:hypothetical protein
MPDTPAQMLTKALIEIQKDLPSVKMNKTGQVQSRTYPYADLGAVTEALFPKLTAHGFAYTAAPMYRSDGHPVLACALTHIGGSALNADWPLPETTDSQRLGAAITYGRRYALCALVGLVADADTDGQLPAEQATERTQEQPQNGRTWRGPREATNDQRLEVGELAAQLDWDAGRLAQEAKANDPTWDERAVPTYAQAQALLLMLRKRVNG